MAFGFDFSYIVFETYSYKVWSGSIRTRDKFKKISLAQQENPKDTCINNGVLEEVIKDKQHAARSALIWNNLYFGSSRRRRVKMKPYWKAENAPLYLWPNILNEVTKYIYLPKDVVNVYRDHK